MNPGHPAYNLVSMLTELRWIIFEWSAESYITLFALTTEE